MGDPKSMNLQIGWLGKFLTYIYFLNERGTTFQFQWVQRQIWQTFNITDNLSQIGFWIWTQLLKYQPLANRFYEQLLVNRLLNTTLLPSLIRQNNLSPTAFEHSLCNKANRFIQILAHSCYKLWRTVILWPIYYKHFARSLSLQTLFSFGRKSDILRVIRCGNWSHRLFMSLQQIVLNKKAFGRKSVISE